MYYDLISTICNYFNVRAVWTTKAITNTNIPINCIFIFGYKEDVHLASKYIAIEINNLETLRLNKQKQYRNRRKLSRTKFGKKPGKSARTKAKEFVEKTLNNIIAVWEGMLNTKPRTQKEKLKYKQIHNFLEQNLSLNYSKFHYKKKPKIERQTIEITNKKLS
jgi:hypothetical protein